MKSALCETHTLLGPEPLELVTSIASVKGICYVHLLSSVSNILYSVFHNQLTCIYVTWVVVLSHHSLALLTIIAYPLPYSDITSSINKQLFASWQHL